MVKKARKAKKRVVKKRKAAKKKVVRKKRAVKKARKTKKAVKGKAKVPKARPKLPAEPIGKVTHFFSKARATAVMIEREGIKVGDTLYFKGHTTNFKQSVASLQINRQPVTEAGPGDEVGIKVKSRTREHDLVFRL